MQGIVGNPVAHGCCCKPPDNSVAKWVVNDVSAPTDPWAEPNTDHDKVVGGALEEGADEASDEVTLKLEIWKSSSADGIWPQGHGAWSK